MSCSIHYKTQGNIIEILENNCVFSLISKDSGRFELLCIYYVLQIFILFCFIFRYDLQSIYNHGSLYTMLYYCYIAIIFTSLIFLSAKFYLLIERNILFKTRSHEKLQSFLYLWQILLIKCPL